MNLRFPLLLIELLVILTVFSIPVVGADMQTKSLKIKVKTEKNLSIKKSLLDLAKNMEKIAKTYKTDNRKAYWENEGKRSFYKLLHAEGYYSSSIYIETNSKKPNDIIFHINAYQPYAIDKITIKHSKISNKNVKLPDVKDFMINSGRVAVAEDIVSVQKRILNYIENNNCLLSLSVKHEAVINHLTKGVDIVYIVDAGPEATIGDITFKGLKTAHPEYVKKLLGLQQGQCFKMSYINKSRGALQKSGLFSSAVPTIPKATNKDGSAPVVFDLAERKPRSFKAGIKYGTDLGLGAKIGWEHRNFFGSGEKIDATFFGNKQEQILNADYTKPFFKRDDQSLKLALKLEKRKSKAFNSKEAMVSGFLERNISKKWTAGVGGVLSQAKITKSTRLNRDNFSLLSFPFFLSLDTRSNILDPRKGHAVKLELAPFFSLNKKEKPFLKTQISGSKYFLIPIKSKPIIALYAATGSILGTKTVKIPHTERFFVGGSNSPRGYAYQLAGNLDSDKRPTGGRSFVKMAVELRFRFTDTIGMVSFLDRGFAHSGVNPFSNKKLLNGAGFGFRYMTDFGPIRADIAFPLKRRKSIDKAFQLYFGIGQVF